MSLVICSPVDLFSNDTDQKVKNNLEDVTDLTFDVPPLTRIGFESSFYRGKITRFNKAFNTQCSQIRSLKLCQMPFPFVFTLDDGSIVMDPTFIAKMPNLEKIEITCCIPSQIIPLLALCLNGRFRSLMINASTLIHLKRYLKNRDLALKESRSFAERIPIHQRSKLTMFLDKIELILHPVAVIDHKGREIEDVRLAEADSDTNHSKELTVDHLKITGLVPKKHRNKIELQWATKPYSRIGINITRISFLPTKEDVPDQPAPATSNFLFFM